MKPTNETRSAATGRSPLTRRQAGLARRGGWIMFEASVAVVLVGMLALALADLLSSAGNANDRSMLRSRCLAAAQAQLDSIAATGEPLKAEDVRRLWPKVDVAIARTDGAGDWAGLVLVKATATGQGRRERVDVTLSRYVAPAEAKP